MIFVHDCQIGTSQAEKSIHSRRVSTQCNTHRTNMAPIRPFKRAISPEDEMQDGFVAGHFTCSGDMLSTGRSVYNRLTGIALDECMPINTQVGGVQCSAQRNPSCMPFQPIRFQRTLSVDSDSRLAGLPYNSPKQADKTSCFIDVDSFSRTSKWRQRTASFC